MSQQVQQPANETQYNRACDACRQHKVRCLPDTSSTSKICQRCARTDRRCVFTAPQKRKQRKRTDTRVAELEREVQAMRSLFEGKKAKDQQTRLRPFFEEEQQSSLDGTGSRNATSISNTPGQSLWETQTPNSNGGANAWTGLTGFTPAGEFCPSPNQNPLIPSGKDVIERGIVSEQLATELFNTYVEELAPHSPMVVFPVGTTAEEVRRSKPTLFLATISASAGKSDPSLFSILSSEVLSAYTHRTVINSEKSLELVQAMLVTSVWYYPPGKFAQLKFYEYIHAAATMAMDLGLGTKPVISRRKHVLSEDNAPHHWGLVSEGPKLDQESDSEVVVLEKKRTYLSCYLVTTGVAMSMRRPSMMRYNSWVAECIESLSNSPHALPTDPVFCHWLRLMVIQEDIYTSFSFDDEPNCANLSETRVQFMLKSFEKRLDNWKKAITPQNDADVIQLSYHYANMYLHEISIHSEHPPEDFRPPFRIDRPLILETDIRLTSIHIDSIFTIISSAHSTLNLLLSMTINTLRSVPIYVYVRMAYSCIVLTKLYTSTRCPTSQIGPVIDRTNLKIGQYLKALIARLTEAVGPMECRSPYTFLGLLMRLNDWFLAQEAQNEWTAAADLFPSEAIMIPLTPPADIGISNDTNTDTSVDAAKNATTATMTAPIQNLSDLMTTTLLPSQIYPLDPSQPEMAALGIKHGFGEPSTAYTPQMPEEFRYEMGMGMSDNFMDPFLLFDGLDGMCGGGNGEMNEWEKMAGMGFGVGGEEMLGSGVGQGGDSGNSNDNMRDWNFG